ncbi:transport between ER and Golgi ATPase protein [Cystobasidiomycetes sp. EMM_F5]
MAWFRNPGGGSDSPAGQPSSGMGTNYGAPPAMPARRQPVPGGPTAGGTGAQYSQYASANTNAGPPSYGQHPATGGYPSQHGHSGRFEVVGTPEDALVLTNRLIVSPSDFNLASSPHVNVQSSRGSFFFSIQTDARVQSGTVAIGKDHRAWCFLRNQGDSVQVDKVDLDKETGGRSYLASATLELAFYSEKSATDQPFDSEVLEAEMRQRLDGNILNVGQPLVISFQNKTLRAVVQTLGNMEFSREKPTAKQQPSAAGGGGQIGIVTTVTEFTFVKTDGARINIKASTKRAAANAVVRPDFNFSDMGIGGLDDEFATMFRRAFASRIFPPGLVEKLGIQHVKGILLYGPPGTGKTLMARQIGKMLNAREPKIVNGPEVLNKFVGQSEENIRKLFADAEKEYKAKGDESGLHIIIFDELDAICKQRGSSGSSTGVGDSIVNQLLSKMDGVDQLNNILIIGMTNRKDMIDEALLRAGRLEVHMEISLPDEFGRLQILNIHTAKMRTNNILDTDVSLDELAASTKNFSGAELNGLVKSATSFAFNRHVKVGTTAGISDDVDKLKVNRGDFMLALDEVKPLFGVAEEELAQVVQNGIIDFAPHIQSILADGQLLVKQVRESPRSHLVSVLMYGLPGAGKTALAATIAQKSQFPFIKLISAENMVGFADSAKISYINKVFSDSYRSPMSVVVVDSIETIIDWVPIGARFSTPCLIALKVLMRKLPPKGRRLLILATTSDKQMLTQMELTDIFDSDIEVYPVNSLESIMAVVQSVDFYQPADVGYRKIANQLLQAGFSGKDSKINIGIKRLLSLIEMARQDQQDPADKFFNILYPILSERKARYAVDF